MPITKSAQQSLRKDQRRTGFNRRLKNRLKHTLTLHSQEKTAESESAVYQIVDRASKKGIIKKNKAARIKSQAAKLTQKPKSNISKSKKKVKKTKTSPKNPK